MINRFRIRLIEIIQNIAVTKVIQITWSINRPEMAGSVSIRITATRWVSGRTARAISWKSTGSKVSGKNVPEKSIIGVMRRNEG